MPESLTFTVTGAREVAGGLSDVARGLAALDVTRAARAVEDAARPRARRLTGAMAASITTTRSAGALAQVTATAPHAPPQHQGTRRGVTPNPFLTDGATAAEATVANIISTDLDALIGRHF